VPREIASRVFAALALVALVVVDLLLKPALAARVPHLNLWEFAVGIVLVPWLLWLTLRPSRRARKPAPRWRRHEQVVRALPDPILRASSAPLESWIERGDAPEAAAAVLARAATNDPAEREAAYARALAAAQGASSRRQREQVIQNFLSPQGA
jgi:hypothetical protein